MKFKFTLISSLFVGLFCPLLACSNEITSLNVNDFTGRWALNCDGSGWLSIVSKENILIEVNANQIYIHSDGKISEQKLIIKLIGPTELGLGGMSLDWDDFSRTVPIAEIQSISDNSVKIKWLGFYDIESNSRKWTKEPDFFDPKNDILNKCSSNPNLIEEHPLPKHPTQGYDAEQPDRPFRI